MIKNIVILFLLSASMFIGAEEKDLSKWKKASVNPVLNLDQKRHSIHTYFNTSPESPDGKYILYFSSKTKDAHSGDICIVNRTTKEETVLATGVTTEDAHRAACQQWAGNGDYIVYHDFVSKVWQIVAIDIRTKTKTVLIKNRQLGFGNPSSFEVPLYGCHWNHNGNPHLETVNIKTTKVTRLIDIKEVLKQYGDWIQTTFGTKDVSIFFPIISPDGKKVFFKVARGSGTENFRSRKASYRSGKLVYDLENKKFINLFKLWGHPAWHPNSEEIIEKGNFTLNIYSGKTKRYAVAKKGKLRTPSDHPSMSPSGNFFVTDANVSKRKYGSPGLWAIILGEAKADSEYLLLHKFQNDKGANSWRHSHPHPVFNAQGNRIYFNVSSDDYTRLYVISLNE
ncbi:MAG: hypothetical protein NE334_20070 [Lentisphaeraceae bacterium]|nr:hypothetical protein [Lentisphaeraceae bacterium]